MKNGGVIFDFNGTLFWDSEYQEIAWEKYIKSHNISLTRDKIRKYTHGRVAKDNIEFLLKRKLCEWEVSRYIEERELIYRNECLMHELKLAPGVISLLHYLNEKKIPMAIATAAGKSNVDFFIDKFNLLDYFFEKNIIYDDGKIKGKPHPDLFNKAIDKLGVRKSETIIFEDSVSGIQAAINCKVSNVIIVNSNNEDYSDFDFPVIEHFDDFDRNLLS